MLAAKIDSPAPVLAQPACLEGRSGRLLIDEPMARHTSWRVGGPADYFYIPADKAELVDLLAHLPTEFPLTLVGLGSNLLVRDAGIRGLVVCMPKGLTDIEQRDTTTLYAQAGVSSAKVAKVSVKKGLSGSEFLAGIPGSFGGALAMNAGAFGGETWSIVSRAELLSRDGQVRWAEKNEFTTAYRRIELNGATDQELIFLGAELSLTASDRDLAEGQQKIKDLLNKRAESQPTQTANAGSVFKNPPGDFAARLLEAAGLKGQQQGGAVFSNKHANFIVNQGDASASDIEALIARGQAEVLSHFGVALVPEVRVIGEAA